VPVPQTPPQPPLVPRELSNPRVRGGQAYVDINNLAVGVQPPRTRGAGGGDDPRVRGEGRLSSVGFFDRVHSDAENASFLQFVIFRALMRNSSIER
jgi:hypothetical protein